MLTDIRSYAIVVVLQVPMAAASDQLLKGASPWFDVFAAYNQLSSIQPFDHIAQSLTSIMLWVAVPSVLGVARSLRREVK